MSESDCECPYLHFKRIKVRLKFRGFNFVIPSATLKFLAVHEGLTVELQQPQLAIRSSSQL